MQGGIVGSNSVAVVFEVQKKCDERNEFFTLHLFAGTTTAYSRNSKEHDVMGRVADMVSAFCYIHA